MIGTGGGAVFCESRLAYEKVAVWVGILEQEELIVLFVRSEVPVWLRLRETHSCGGWGRKGERCGRGERVAAGVFLEAF